jgi:hypothetical protein
MLHDCDSGNCRAPARRFGPVTSSLWGGLGEEKKKKKGKTKKNKEKRKREVFCEEKKKKKNQEKPI